MAAELAFINILKSDNELIPLLGNRVRPIQQVQTGILPSCVVRKIGGTEPSDTKDGPSTLDVERIQVLMYFSDWTTPVYTIQNRVRYLLDRLREGTYNGVTVQSSQFEDDDNYEEQIVDKKIFVVEQIYKVRVKR
jgi:hypothetical protein